MNFESLIFDIDGTLWDSRSLVAEGWNRMFRAEGYHRLVVTVEKLTPLFGKSAREIADILLAPIPEDSRYEMMERCFQAEHDYLASNPCQVGYPNVAAVISELAAKHRIFIVSNSEQGYPELCMEKLGLTPYISGHLCHGDTRARKGETIRILMDRHNIESCVYIGDTQGDYEATVQAGIPFIWASYGFGNPEGYTRKIDAFEELLNL